MMGVGRSLRLSSTHLNSGWRGPWEGRQGAYVTPNSLHNYLTRWVFLFFFRWVLLIFGLETRKLKLKCR